GTNLIQLEISGTMFIGELYKLILNRLEVSSRQVIGMYYNNLSLGQDPLNFEKSLVHAGFYNNCMIFVILNHYPALTELYCQTTHQKYQQWLNRDQYRLDANHLQFDPVLRRRRP